MPVSPAARRHRSALVPVAAAFALCAAAARAQGDPPPASVPPADAAASAAAPASAPARAPSAAQELGRVQVTGSRLKRIDAEGPVPVQVYRREDLERSGQPSLERFLASLNEVSVGAGEGAHSGTAGQGTVQLRGMPLGSTLLLINGRRVQAAGSSDANYFNLNVIPMAAVSRVEVVPVGSSAVYGGDALAGVVNIILRDDLDGVSLDTRLGAGRGFGDGSVSLAAGRRGGQGSFLVLGSYSKATPLNMSERAFFLDADFRRFGGPDARSRNCAPGTVSSTTSANLPGLSATTAGIPAGATQPLTVAAFAPTAGQPNLCAEPANGNGNALVFGSENLALHAVGEWRPEGRWKLFGEATASDERLATNFTGPRLNNVLVPASNPYNPFGVPVRVTSTLGLENGATGTARTTRFARVLGGAKGELGGDWELEATASTSRDHGEQRYLNVNLNGPARTAALASTSLATALNPFTAGRAASDELLRSIWSDTVRQFEGRKDQVTVLARGPMARLPAGVVDAVAGVEAARDVYDSVTLGSAPNTASRSAQAVYGEARLPLLPGTASGQAPSLMALTLAARGDRTSDFGSAGTYQAGLEFRPGDAWLLRASAATSFKPPTLYQTAITEQLYPASVFVSVDPARGNEPITTASLVRRSNPDLQPERGKAFALGTTWEPGSGLRLGATAWQLRADRMIVILSPQTTLANEALFPGFVTREPAANGVPGRLTSLVYTETNLGYIDTRGVDLEAQGRWRTGGGAWTAAASATHVSRYDVKITPGAAVESRLGRRSTEYWAPRWKGRASAGFEAPAWGIGLTARYLGRYLDAGNSTRRLGNVVVYDLAARIDLRRVGVPIGSAKAASLSMAVVNLGNRLPEFAEGSPYFDVSQADWRGRTASLRLSVDW